MSIRTRLELFVPYLHVRGFIYDTNAHKDRCTNHHMYNYQPLDVGTGRPPARGADEHAFKEE